MRGSINGRASPRWYQRDCRSGGGRALNRKVGMSNSSVIKEVREYWEQEPCGTGQSVTAGSTPLTLEWFERVEAHRYEIEPMIHAVAQFTRWRGRKMLEVGVGAGTDHLQWARAGCECHGVDLTDAGIETTRQRLSRYGLASRLQRVNAEVLPFDDASFDLVYSWGVIHHSDDPQKIVEEIHRVLRPGGTFIGMMYARRSLVALRYWALHGLFKGRPWRSLSDVLWHHMESVGTKAYTHRELRRMFGRFADVRTQSHLTTYDTHRLPAWLTQFFPDRAGWFISIRARK